MKKLEWRNEKRKIDDLIPFEGNPRQMTEKQRSDLEKSLKKFNLVEIPAINTDNRIIAGHQRLKILQALGRGKEEIDVRIPNRKLTDEEFREYNLRSNKNLGEFNNDLLANFDEKMLIEAGWESEELDQIFQLDLEEDEVPELPKEAMAKLGEIYQLGEHRLMVGDATKKEDVERLMGGEKADMVFTDPPYNVDYGSNKKHPSWKIRNIKGDKQTASEWEDFNKKWIQNVIDFYKGGDIYIWGAPGPEGMKQRLWLNELGFHWSATIIWKKDHLVLCPAKYQRIYEPCFYGWLKKSSFVGNRKQVEVWETEPTDEELLVWAKECLCKKENDVWEIDRPIVSKEHPTMKPLEVCGKAIRNSSKRDDIVLDIFGGSGSTLIACEQLNRKCYMMELDPKYIDVIINRYEQFTGKKAKKC